MISRANPGIEVRSWANGDSPALGISSNGLRVLFASDASNLVTNDHNSCEDVFVRDRASQRTLLVSVNAAGTSAANASSTAAVMSPDGGFVAFESAASDLVTNDLHGLTAVFLRDLATATTRLVSVNRAGTGGGNGASGNPALSSDGRWVAFESLASDLVANDTNQVSDIFVRDLRGGETRQVSVEIPGSILANGRWLNPSITPDGRWVAFLWQSEAPRTNGAHYGSEVFVRDLPSGATHWASAQAAGFFPEPTATVAWIPVLSADGRYLAFKIASAKTVLVARRELATGRTQLIDSNHVSDRVFYELGSSLTDFSGPQISANGEIVAYTRASAPPYRTESQVYVWDGLAAASRCVSLNGAGTAPGNQDSVALTLSADGRTVVFASLATDLVTNAVPGVMQLYARDLTTERTKRVCADYLVAPSVKSDFALPALSGDGRWVAWNATAHPLAPKDDSSRQNACVQDLATDTLELVSRGDHSLASATAHGPSGRAVKGVSADGRYVVFTSLAGNLVFHDTNGVADVFRRDLITETTALVSVNRAGIGGGNGASLTPVMSAEGRWIAFASYASDLAGNDTNNALDVYVRDLDAGTNLLVSECYDHSGPGNSWSDSPWISPEARFVVFRSGATNLLPGAVLPPFGPQWYLRDLISRRTVLITAHTNSNFRARPAGALAGVSAPLNLAIMGEAPLSRRIYAYDLITRDISFLANYASQPAMSDNGFWLAYQRHAFHPTTNFVLRDLVAGRDFRVGLPPSAFHLSVSDDGRLVAYEALVPTQNTIRHQVYIHDARQGSDRLISANRTDKLGGSGNSRLPLITPDGRYVVFQSQAGDLVANDTNGVSDIFLRDLAAETTCCLSTNRFGTGPGNGLSGNASLGMDGRSVVFESFATDLVDGDHNTSRDVFLVRLPDR